MAWRCFHLVHPVNLKVVALPVEVAHLLHSLGAKGVGEEHNLDIDQQYLGALQCAWEPEWLFPGLKMLCPQRHTEHVNLVNRRVNNSEDELKSKVNHDNSNIWVGNNNEDYGNDGTVPPHMGCSCWTGAANNQPDENQDDL